MRKKDQSYLLQEAKSFCFKQKFKVLQQAERGGSWKSPPRVSLIVSNKGKRIRGSKRYEQNSKDLEVAINHLYLKYYEENCPEAQKVNIGKTEEDRKFYISRSGEKIYTDGKDN